MNSLLFKKLVLAFALGFVPPLLTGLAGILTGEVEVDFTSWQALGLALLSVVSGALAIGLRYLLAEFTNIMPTDSLHGSNSQQSVTVTKDS